MPCVCACVCVCVTQVYDGWYVDPVATVDLSHMGMIEPLDSYISADRQADWADVSRYAQADTHTHMHTYVLVQAPYMQ